MKLGFVSAILPDSSLPQVLQIAAQQKFDCVELMCWPPGRADRRYAGVSHIDVTRLTQSDAARIRDQVLTAGVEISALGYYPNLLAPDRRAAQAAAGHLKKVIAAASKLGVGLVNTFAGRDKNRTIDQNWPQFLKVFRPLVKLAEDCGVKIGIENCPMHFTADEWPGGNNLAVSPPVWRRMFEDIPSLSLGLNYDPSHLVWQQIDPLRPLREFAGRLLHVHAKDVRINRAALAQVGIAADPLAFHSPVLPGRGEMEWKRFLKELRRVGYRGAVCVEVEDRDYEKNLVTRVAALRRSSAYLKKLIPGRKGAS